MNDKENIIKGLYNKLEKLKYPEVAQINYQEFEGTILIGNKRVELLHWLLQENPNFNCNLLNKFKEISLEDKLLKCYSQMGFCNSEEILLGKCEMDEQLHFLSLISLFINRIYSTKTESVKCDKENVHKVVEVVTTNVSSSTNCIGEEKSNCKSENTFSEGLKSLEPTIAIDNEQNNDLEKMCCDIKSILEKLKKHENNIYEQKLLEFYKSYENITSLPFENNHFNNSFDDIKTDIEQIHTKFSTINKVLVNQVEFNNRPTIAANDEKITKPLSLAISNNLVSVQHAYNTLKENEI
ncbi:uncharacterized protein LOC131671222 [Phymastichus coffea]|uniref:uncharacterized protein LOC131671222 n=1 Tax=Phymastichus coffea TaxID=108790 RepID=UPI00273A761C|nr:uncharacterized protein LOC131671222 [Phymastichus coffea]XP_058803468.1 uncharacterized protein LOC131671222 [Phymastichus coffea]